MMTHTFLPLSPRRHEGCKLRLLPEGYPPQTCTHTLARLPTLTCMLHMPTLRVTPGHAIPHLVALLVTPGHSSLHPVTLLVTLGCTQAHLVSKNPKNP